MTVVTELTFQQIQSVFSNNLTKFFKNTDYLFQVNVSKEDMWNTYIESFPEENGLRQSFNCNNCRSFIRKFGNVVKIVNNTVISIWNVNTGDAYMDLAFENLKKLIKVSHIENAYYPRESRIGVKNNLDLRAGHTTLEWHHFYVDIPARLIKFTDSTRNNEQVSLAKGRHNSFWNGTRKITIQAISTVLELIEQNSVPSGRSFKNTLQIYLQAREKHESLTDDEKMAYRWVVAQTMPQASTVSSNAIGVLLKDISDDMSVDQALQKFGSSVMNRQTYMRSQNTAKVGTNSTQKAIDKLNELGLTESLDRRLASTEDVSINNLIWTNRDTRTLEDNTRPSALSILEDMKEEKQTINPKQFDRVESVSMAKFLKDVVPTCQKIEILFENSLCSNLVSLISPVNLDAPALTKWDNGFTWSYKGGYADSVKEMVKRAGGAVDGVVGHRVAWYNTDDLDAHVIEPSGFEIDFNAKKSRSTGGFLDVDMNATSPYSESPVENITYPELKTMKEGVYEFIINQYNQRNRTNFGFIAEVECKISGKIYSFEYHNLMPTNTNITVMKYRFTKTRGIEIIESLPVSSPNAPKWGLNPNKFQEATMIMRSPNYWSEQGVGDEHIFFMLKGAENQDALIRGFYNEQLKSDLYPHRRVFEVLGSRLEVNPAPSQNQLTGLGFQLTKDAKFVARVSGNVTRTLKVTV